jgi:hypothetical protein
LISKARGRAEQHMPVGPGFGRRHPAHPPPSGAIRYTCKDKQYINAHAAQGAVNMTKAAPSSNKEGYFTISAIYKDNRQRYATSYGCDTPDEAAAFAILSAREDNKTSKEIEICAIFRGKHECMDKDVWYAKERPKYVPSRAKVKKPFTVVLENSVLFVQAPNGRLAEYQFASDSAEVSGVFSGHLENLVDQVNWDTVKKIAAESLAEV